MFFKRIIKHSNMGFNIHKLHSITCAQEISNDVNQNLNQTIYQVDDPVSYDPVSYDPVSYDPVSYDPVSYVTEESTLTMDQIIQALCVFSAMFPSHN